MIFGSVCLINLVVACWDNQEYTQRIANECLSWWRQSFLFFGIIHSFFILFTINRKCFHNKWELISFHFSFCHKQTNSFSISRCLYFWFNSFSYSKTFFWSFSEKKTDSYLFHFTRTLNCLFSLWKSLNLHLTISDFLNQVSRGISIISSSRNLISSLFENFLIAWCISW